MKADRDEIKELLKKWTQQAAEKNYYLEALIEHTIGRSLQYEAESEEAQAEETFTYD